MNGLEIKKHPTASLPGWLIGSFAALSFYVAAFFSPFLIQLFPFPFFAFASVVLDFLGQSLGGNLVRSGRGIVGVDYPTFLGWNVFAVFMFFSGIVGGWIFGFIKRIVIAINRLIGTGKRHDENPAAVLDFKKRARSLALILLAYIVLYAVNAFWSHAPLLNPFFDTVARDERAWREEEKIQREEREKSLGREKLIPDSKAFVRVYGNLGTKYGFYRPVEEYGEHGFANVPGVVGKITPRKYIFPFVLPPDFNIDTIDFYRSGGFELMAVSIVPDDWLLGYSGELFRVIEAYDGSFENAPAPFQTDIGWPKQWFAIAVPESTEIKGGLQWTTGKIDLWTGGFGSYAAVAKAKGNLNIMVEARREVGIYEYNNAAFRAPSRMTDILSSFRE